jgi:hypothetical protein
MFSGFLLRDMPTLRCLAFCRQLQKPLAIPNITTTCCHCWAWQEDINKNISQEEAAAKERYFYERDTFFGSAVSDVMSVREGFGVDTLRVQLSKQLVSLTQRELPKMKEALDKVLAEVGEMEGVELYTCKS